MRNRFVKGVNHPSACLSFSKTLKPSGDDVLNVSDLNSFTVDQRDNCITQICAGWCDGYL